MPKSDETGALSQVVDPKNKDDTESERYSSDMVRRILESCPFALVMARLEDRLILYESPANNEMFGEEEDTKAKYIGVYDVDPREREEYIARLKRDGFVNEFEMRFRGLDGTEFVSALSGRLIDFNGEKVIVSGAVDLTERRAVEAELAAQREALFQSEKLSALGELLAGVAHELNNPLSVVVGHAMLLKEMTSDPEIALRLEKIGAAAERCARIVKSFLAMARQQTAQFQPVDMNEVARTAIEVTGYALRSANIEVELKLDAQLPNVCGDAAQLGQVLTNLIVNAEQALEEREGPRRLTIETAHQPGSENISIKVADNGPGVAQELRNRIFEPLFTTKELGIGTGIGLALCHRIVETHNGEIALKSSPGDGAIFSIELPIEDRHAQTQGQVASSEKVSRKLKVLIIDDELEVADLIEDILSADRHHCAIANSGIEALEAIENARFDVIICDLRMPGLSGQELYGKISEKFPEYRNAIGFITGDTLSQKSRNFLRKVKRPFIEKPVTTEEVRELVKKIFEKRVLSE